MVNTFKHFLPWNKYNNFNETWYVASGTRACEYMAKLLPWVDVDLFFGKVKFCNLGFYIEKCDSDGFFGNYCSLWPENWLIYLTYGVNEGI